MSPTQHQLQQLQCQEALPNQVSTLTSFLQSCMKLLRNQNALDELRKLLNTVNLSKALLEEKLSIELEGLEEK